MISNLYRWCIGVSLWTGILLVFSLSAAAVDAPAQPPIPIRFNLPDDGFVTLVIDGANGKRVRNLISETPFPKGDNVVWWDGTDDLLRDPEAYRHGLYSIPAEFVSPGGYQVRGIFRKA